MTELQFESLKDQDEQPREDLDAYCPRIDKEILLLDGRCFSPDRGPICCACAFDTDQILVKLILIMSEILTERGS
jgi:hypothetical protein